MRKATLFALVLALVAGMAIAQNEMGRKSTAGANFTTGVVEQVDKSGISIREDSGQVVTFIFQESTVGALNYAVGSRVRVTWQHNDQAQRLATEVQGAEIAPPKVNPPPVVTYSDATPPPAPAPAPKYVAPTPAPAPAAVAPVELPKTATQLPALGLLGLMLLGAGLVLRKVA